MNPAGKGGGCLAPKAFSGDAPQEHGKNHEGEAICCASVARTMRGGNNLLCECGENHEGAAMRREGTAGVLMVHVVIKTTNGNEGFVTNKMKKF